MSNGQSKTSAMPRLAALATPMFACMLLIVAAAAISIFEYDRIGKVLSDWFNVRSDKFYSAAFTLLVAFWGASLTVWALLKSRATKYIERLHDNYIFSRFIKQYERRLVYAFAVLLASFSIYIQDVKLSPQIDLYSSLPIIWLAIYLCVMAALADVIITARTVL